MASRISFIERQLDKMAQSQASVHKNVIQDRPVLVNNQNINEQSGYFRLPVQKSLTEAYFKGFSISREADSHFSAYKRDKKAEFRPLEGTQYLNDMKSIDTIKMALEINGCALSEAKQMKIDEPGEAQKDGDRWIITKKATITLFK